MIKINDAMIRIEDSGCYLPKEERDYEKEYEALKYYCDGLIEDKVDFEIFKLAVKRFPPRKEKNTRWWKILKSFKG